MSNEQLNDAEIHEKAAQLALWTLQEKMLCRQFVFKDFVAAFDFMKVRIGRVENDRNYEESQWERIVIWPRSGMDRNQTRNFATARSGVGWEEER